MPKGSEILAAIAKGQVDAVYYLCGEERWLVDRALALIAKAVLGDDAAAKTGLAYDRLIAREAGGAGILSAASTLPMLCKRRLVVVREVDALSAKEQEQLLSYAGKPNPQTCLVLVGDKADLRSKFFIGLDRLGALYRFERLKERELPVWLSSEARRLGAVIEPDAARLLTESLGTDLGALSQALERLALYAGGPIRAEHVEESVSAVRVRSVFELCAAVSRADLAGALTVLQRMQDDRQSPVGVVTMLARHFRQLWMTKELRQTGANEAAIAQRLGIRPYFVSSLVEQSRRLSVETLRRVHTRLLAADRSLKSSRLGDQQILELCVIQLVELVRVKEPARAMPVGSPLR